MRRTSLAIAITAAVLVTFAGWNTASSSHAEQTRLPPVAGADYVISMAIVRQPQGQAAGTIVTVTYSLAKGDGAVAYEGNLQGSAASQEDVLRQLLRRATDEIAGMVLEGRVPPRPHTSQTASALR